MIYLAADPGKMTGWATWDGEWKAGQCPHMEFLARQEAWLASAQAQGIPATLIMERFVISGGTVRKTRGDVNWSIEQIGVARRDCAKYDARLVLQSASDAKKFASNQRLRDIGWWSKGMDHANDASRHLLLGLGSFEVDTFAKILKI